MPGPNASTRPSPSSASPPSSAPAAGARGGSLSARQIAQFNAQGWLHVAAAISAEQFAPLEAALTRLIDAQAARWLEAGHIKSVHAELGFGARLAAVAAELSDELYDTELREFCATLDGAHRTTPAGVGFFFCEGLLDAVESIVGGEISANPISHIRPYVPARDGRGRSASRDPADRGRWPHRPEETRWSAHPMATWHMDQTVTSSEADGIDILTVWSWHVLSCLPLPHPRTSRPHLAPKS
eukprot:SAG22_NODE_7_length_40155_cov_25.241356_30_plen_241_part_00